MTGKPPDGIVVVALEQAVAAPFCSSRLAHANTRVIKIERPEDDFACGYVSAVLGESSMPRAAFEPGQGVVDYSAMAASMRAGYSFATLQHTLRRPTP